MYIGGAEILCKDHTKVRLECYEVVLKSLSPDFLSVMVATSQVSSTATFLLINSLWM